LASAWSLAVVHGPAIEMCCTGAQEDRQTVL